VGGRRERRPLFVGFEDADTGDLDASFEEFGYFGVGTRIGLRGKRGERRIISMSFGAIYESREEGPTMTVVRTVYKR
jgi:hypothetical protein